MKFQTPKKPFPDYKWTWATLMPTESLNLPEVLLGVLRAAAKCEGKPKNSKDFVSQMKEVEEGLKGKLPPGLSLKRHSAERNLLRNSAQYWQLYGLLEKTRGIIKLTPLGRSVASGEITIGQFAAAHVEAFTLPVPGSRYEDQWNKVGLAIKPLRLLLDVMQHLVTSEEEGYLTKYETRRIVIPLAGSKNPASTIAKAVSAYRAARLNVEEWPVCETPGSNDHRFVDEYFLFLSHHGFVVETKVASEVRYYYSERSGPAVVIPGAALFKEGVRVRATRELWIRPTQAAFRRNVMKAFAEQCVVTRETLTDTLEAAHIVPVENNGTDDKSNGLCLRADIHALFDVSHLRIRSDGVLERSRELSAAVSYKALPTTIDIPPFVSREALEWRLKFK